jgi:hypothetical protein
VLLAACALRHACPDLHPAQTLLAATLASAADVANGIYGIPGHRQAALIPQGSLRRMAIGINSMGALSPPLGSPLPAAAVLLSSPCNHAHLAGLAWTSPAGVALPTPPLHPAAGPLTVRAITSRLTAPIARERWLRHAAYARAALGAGHAANVDVHTRGFRATLKHAWALPMANPVKEPLWRLAIDSIPGARIPGWQCPCSLHRPPPPSQRLHAFWECPVALAVREQLRAALGMAPPRAAVWLLASPTPACCGLAWVAVCLAALDAMEHGRKLLWAVRCSPQWADPGPGAALLLHRALPPNLFAAHVRPHLVGGRDAAVASVASQAACRFWHNLQDFARGCPVPPAEWAVPHGHPFLHLEGGRLALHIPAEANAPAAEED